MSIKNGKLVVPSKVIMHMNREGSLNLVRKFLGSRPDMDTIRMWTFSRWKPQGRMEVSIMPNGFFMIKLSSEANIEKVLNTSPWLLGNRSIFLRNWDPYFNP